MHFKGLEIVGFKSFLNKTKLKFEPGVTAVVGPNGCGKSNIVDAIKWVLGEQSAKSMRSTAMGDVIFNGTEKHDAVNVAEVSLTLSNEDRALPVDFDEVIISRRLYRSGESEYLLNKMPVRLTDVRSLLMGTGIGTSSYSVVEQGRMDMILSSKPEERRYIFEEASGITRFKAKKREALLKLDRTKENLVRINDITREVERQIKSIERQARKAERYKARFEELKDLDLKLAYKKFRALTDNDSSLGTEDGELKSTVGSLAKQLEEASSSLTNLRMEYNNILEDLQKSQGELMTASSDISKNKHTIQVDIERVDELRKEVQRLDWEIEEATERKEVLSGRLEGLELRFSDVSRKRQEKTEQVTAAEERALNINQDLERYNHELKLNRDKTLDVVSEQTKAKNSLIKISADVQNIHSRKRRLDLEMRSVEQERENISEEFNNIQERASQVKKELEDKRSEHDVFNAEYTSRQNSLMQLNNERSEKEKRVNEIRPRRQFLEKLIQEREGINESVKDIMTRAEGGDPRFIGVKGILSELINVREHYGEAMESVLGDVAQAIVVDDKITAGGITSYLEENSMTSVSFVILEEVKKLLDKQNGNAITKGTLDDITHIISAKEPFSSALKVLFKDTFVTVSSDAASNFMDENNDFSGRIIGEKGEIYQKGMRRSRNYSQKEVIPLFGRKEKVEEMLAEEEGIGLAIGEISKNIEETEAWLKESSIKKERLESELREKQLESADVNSRLAIIKDKFGSLEEEVTLLKAEIAEEDENLQNLTNEKNQLEESLKTLEEESGKLNSLIDEAQNMLKERNREREEMLFLLSDIKAELSSLTREEESLSENLERDKEIHVQFDHAVEDKRSRITSSGQRIRDLETEIETLGAENIEHEALVGTKGAEVDEQKATKEKLIEVIQLRESEVKHKEQTLEAARDKTRDLDLKKKDLEYQRSILVDKITEAYKIDITQVTMELDEDTNWDEVAREVGELKHQLEKMGDISLGAVEEHKQLEERFQFLSKQRDDLEKGREDLMQAIQKINRTTRKMFMETFEAIRKEFNNYFRMLFNGGRAELVLEDESNILECGINIVVRPPGKKLHNIMQLSGGEKAMTAIALIFAIFKVNPSPFCILDEIDAPLDESNIVRFCRVLQDFIKLSQFVIVTHNRMTIQLADVLYGITMEEKGVSKMVSVKFSEEKETPDKETIPQAV